MTHSPMGPGTVLAGRYRLDDLLAETDGAKFWRATDQVLARSVAVNVLDADDPRAEEVLVAARTSAAVTDGHILQVLDAATEEGVSYVVHEWGSGISLDRMLSDGPLPPRRAAWLVKEVADAITTAHRHGIAHGRLVPENVMVSEAGSVKLIGFAVDAVLNGEPFAPASHEDAGAGHDSDVVNLAALLYAGLVGRWPGVARSSLPDAPRERGRTLRPRQVRAGIPRPLDAICDRVLNQETHPHSIPIRTAHEMSAALSDFVGDAAGAAQVAFETTAVLPAGTLPVDPTRTPAEQPGQDASQDATQDPHGQASPEQTTDPEATQAGAPVFYDDGTGVGWVSAQSAVTEREGGRRSPAPPPQLPPLPPPKPLFAPETPDERGRRERAGRHAATPGAEDSEHGTHGSGSMPAVWPWEPEPGESERAAEPAPSEAADAGRSWLRLAGVVAFCLALALAAIVAFDLGRGRGPDTGTAGEDTSASGSPSAPSRPVTIAGVSDFDPQADPPEENPELADLAVDGDPSTAWRTVTYYNDPRLALLKDGVGLLLDLGTQQQVSHVALRLQGSPTDLTVFAAPKGAGRPTDVDGLRKLGSVDGAGERVRIDLDEPVTTRYLVVWLTSLPPVENGYAGRIAEVDVRS